MNVLIRISIIATTTRSALTILQAGTHVLVTEDMKATELNALSSTPRLLTALLQANKSTSISTLVVSSPSRRPLLARSVLSPRSVLPQVDRRMTRLFPSLDPMRVTSGNHLPAVLPRVSSKILMDNQSVCLMAVLVRCCFLLFLILLPTATH